MVCIRLLISNVAENLKLIDATDISFHLPMAQEFLKT